MTISTPLRSTVNYAHLNAYIEPSNKAYAEAWKRVLCRLGDDTALIVKSLNMRPTRVSLLGQTYTHILVRISTPGEHVVLRISPERHLAPEVYFGRKMATRYLPAVRILKHDLKRTLVSFDYIIENYVGGSSAAQIHDPSQLRSIARQAGRVIRRMHCIPADGWGAPSQINRWTTPDWFNVLKQLQTRLAPAPMARLIFGEEKQQALDTLLEHPALTTLDEPRLMHGALTPHAVRCTVGTHINLAALVDPGSVVGGDGLLDLAWGLDPELPAEWRNGLLEGYLSIGSLSEAEHERLRLLSLLTCSWSACQRYMRAQPYHATRDRVLALLDEHHPC